MELELILVLLAAFGLLLLARSGKGQERSEIVIQPEGVAGNGGCILGLLFLLAIIIILQMAAR